MSERRRSPFRLIDEVFRTVGDDLRRWLLILRREPLLSGFLLLSWLLFNVLLWLNLGAYDLPGWAVVAAFPLNWLLFHGGLILLAVAARRTTAPPPPPRVRRPRLELAGLLLWLTFITWASYLRGHDQPQVWPGSWLTAMFEVCDGLALPFTQSEPLLKMLRTFHCLATVPLLFLLLCGNPPADLGCGKPRSDWRGMALWAGLLFLAVAKAATAGGNVLAGVAGSLVLAGFAEELLFRVGLQTRLEAVLGNPLQAMVIAAPIFALIHLTAPQEQPLWSLANALGAKAMLGLVFGHLYYRTRSLWPGMLLHATFDVALFAGAGAW